MERTPLFLQGNAIALLATFPSACIDCALTSPPYWGQRAYASVGRLKMLSAGIFSARDLGLLAILTPQYLGQLIGFSA